MKTSTQTAQQERTTTVVYVTLPKQ